MTQRVLVTGGAGVIARELLELLSERAATVLSIDRLPLPTPAPTGVRHLQADLADADLTPIIDFDPEVVIHLAATFERSVESPEFWAQNWADNVVVTHRLVEAAERLGRLQAFVFASSYLVYRTSQYLVPSPPAAAAALAEDAPLEPRNLCGAAKLYAEAELAFARGVRRAPWRAISARIYRVYGRGSRDVVSRWVRSVIRGEPIEVYHPENQFDYVYSRDVAEGLVRLAGEPRADGIVNLATGRACPVSDVLATIAAATGRQPDIRASDAGDEPYEASRADVTRLQELLGWSPQITHETGVAKLVAHEREAAGVA